MESQQREMRLCPFFFILYTFRDSDGSEFGNRGNLVIFCLFLLVIVLRVELQFFPSLTST